MTPVTVQCTDEKRCLRNSILPLKNLESVLPLAINSERTMAGSPFPPEIERAIFDIFLSNNPRDGTIVIRLAKRFKDWSVGMSLLLSRRDI